MRVVKVFLKQSAEDDDLFKVTRFSGTAALSVGQEIPRSTLEHWTDKSCFPRVEFTVVGREDAKEETEETESIENNRLNVLEPF